MTQLGWLECHLDLLERPPGEHGEAVTPERAAGTVDTYPRS